MSVDTYARKANLAAYHSVRQDGVDVLVSKRLTKAADSVRLELKRFLFLKSLDVRARLYGHPT
ncbi:MAG: hypothetical protein HY682_11080 [Chloroflexi bacterium]|nr:hypothetical protein [Chloroflexota bacterium]